jgi:diguanylate cyclase (GGDEF)-like protein
VTTEGSLQETRVLIAHTSSGTRRAMRDVLEPVACAVAEAADAEEAIAAMAGGRFDVLLLDHRLADALPRIKGDPELFGAAVVLLGEPPDVETAIGALDRGAHDVLREDPAPAEVVARVRAARRACEMQAQLLTRERDLEALAYRDELTGLANRRYALRQLAALISRARRHGQDLSVLVIDADRFKSLNDRHGHQAGDAVLTGLAARLAERVRREDVVARLGGEEFLVLLPDTDAEGAAAVAEDLRAAVAARPFPVGRFALALTISAGHATWRGEDAERLVARADRGLYAAKEAGRDRVCAGDAANAR